MPATEVLQAKGTNVIIKLDEKPSVSAGGIAITDWGSLARVGTVISAGEDSELREGDRIVRSTYGWTDIEGGLKIGDENEIWCKIEDGDLLVPFRNRVVVILDPLTDKQLMIPDKVRLKQDVRGELKDLRMGTVIDAGKISYKNGNSEYVYKPRNRVAVKHTVYH